MTLDEALQGVKIIFLDTAPVVYYVENHPLFADGVEGVIKKMVEDVIEGDVS